MPLIFLHLLFIITSLLSYTSKNICCLNYYAMVSSIYLKEKSKSTELSYLKIKINRCNEYALQKIGNFNFKTKSLEKKIYILKTSGCISTINKYTILYAKYKQTIFNIDIYPIINQINIQKYKKLKIGPKFLQKLFKYQLGLPKNQLLLDSILHKIHDWYLLRGYKWSSINVKFISEVNKLNFIINEGRINSVHIKCKTNQIKKNVNLMNHMILF
uniref:POTRA domain-containing protein n=1 Tax=Gracilaria hainanensis TaxID=2871843 RepID=A0AAU7YPL8_9FLOR